MSFRPFFTYKRLVINLLDGAASTPSSSLLLVFDSAGIDMVLDNNDDLYGDSQIATKTARGDINITTRVQIATVGAAPFFQRTAVLHAVTNAICVLELDGTSRQKIQGGNLPRAKIRAKIRWKDMFPMGDKQGHPFKLAVLAKDIRRVALANVDAGSAGPIPSQSLGSTYNTLFTLLLMSFSNTAASLIALIKRVLQAICLPRHNRLRGLSSLQPRWDQLQQHCTTDVRNNELKDGLNALRGICLRSGDRGCADGCYGVVGKMGDTTNPADFVPTV
ncbi:hypothetical protein FIBSPDRAFT_961874 [Athelia psychrophila]|uniref:Uncharacterized protein n=1 Tax=Athelia psychrophila TaxID=1759441 RepID=A0A166ATG5_9AGAM|nr:hypothetical protein FIBSPDRAFT_961874 [Fibularhizoctonia sp. CBS 109695]